MSVLIMQMLSPELSFVLHTVSPLEHDENVLYAELAVGQVRVGQRRAAPERLQRPPPLVSTPQSL